MIPECKSNDILFLNHFWALRNDRTNVILYSIEDLKIQYYHIPYDVSVVVQLLDGTKTYREIIESFQYIFQIPDYSSSKEFVDKIFSHLNENEEIVKLSPVKIDCPPYQQGDFFIPIEKYNIQKKRTFYPLDITFVLTNRCSTDCVYCYAERAKTQQKEELDINQWKRLVDEAKQYGIWKVEVTGGDPFIREDAIELYEYLIEKEISFFISTKSFISQDIAFRLSQKGFSNPIGSMSRNIQISVDSHDTKTAEFLTKKKNYLSIAKRSISNLHRNNIIPRIKSVLTPYNYTHIESIIQEFSKYGITNFQFVQYGRSMYRHHEELFLTKDQKLYLHNEYQRLREKYTEFDLMFQDDLGDYDYTDLRLPIEKWKQRSRCSGGFSSMQILPNGDVLLCDQLPEKPDFIMGNVVRENILDVWNGDLIKNFLFSSRDKFSNTACFSCSDFEECHYQVGYCYRDSLFHYGTLYDAPPRCPYQTKPAKRMM